MMRCRLPITTLYLLLHLCVALTSCQKSGPSSDSSIAIAPSETQTRTASGPQKGALIQASAQGNTSMVLSLIQQGSNPDEAQTSDNNRITPLMAAILRNKQDVIEILIQKGAKDTGEYLGYKGRDFALQQNQDRTIELLDATEQ